MKSGKLTSQAFDDVRPAASRKCRSRHSSMTPQAHESYCEWMKAVNWPPGFVSQIITDGNGRIVPHGAKTWYRKTPDTAEMARRRREGVGWGNNTLPMNRTPKNLPPAWMDKP
jgi:hypothetical protein